MAIEYELKFRATEDQLNRLQQEIPGREQRFSMETTYYDTPSGALSQRYYTLRRRMENHRSVCTLKTPADQIGRREFEVEAPHIQAALPELCKRSGIAELPELLKEGLIPLCGARFTRIARTVCLPNCTVELALDRGVLIGGKRELPLLEVEVELKEGTPDAALAYATALAQKYGLEPEQSSKFRRAMQLAKEEGEEVL